MYCCGASAFNFTFLEIAPLAQAVLLDGQLDGKLKVHRLLLTFLSSTGLLERLNTYQGTPSKQMLYERTENIVAAKTLRQLQSE